MIITVQSSFSSAHFYAQPKWDEERNREAFGRCYTPFGHGHNYTLEVGFRSSSSGTSTVQSYQNLLKGLTETLDHEHLNFVIPEFKDSNPTTENIGLYFVEKLKQLLPAEQIAFVRLYEMENLWTEIHL